MWVVVVLCSYDEEGIIRSPIHGIIGTFVTEGKAYEYAIAKYGIIPFAWYNWRVEKLAEP